MKQTTVVWHNEIPQNKIEVTQGATLAAWFLVTNKFVAKPLEIILRENAELSLFGLVVIGKDAQMEINITVVHQGTSSRSRVKLKAVLFENAELKFEPLARVSKGARGANAEVEIKTLLVGDKSRDISIPSMEIDEQEASARHAVTIGRVNDEELFYIQTRGLDRVKGERLLISGFANDFTVNAPKDLQPQLNALYKTYDLIT